MYKQIIEEIKDQNVRLVAVSKTRSIEEILRIYEKGQRIFGENRVQELVDKHAKMPADIQWHLIGHLQSKKVKHIAAFVEMIHSVDSDKLLQEINTQAAKKDRTIKVLLQCKIAQEEAKYGLDEQSLVDILKSTKLTPLGNVQIVGLMGMATFTNDESIVCKEFKKLKGIFDRIVKTDLVDESFKEISMGMSGDYKLAIKEGSTMIRVGSLIFG